MAADGEPAFVTAVLVPSKQELQLQTVPLAVAAFPSRAGNQLMKVLGSAAPLSDLRQLKRVRKAPDDGTLLEAVLCALPESTLGELGDGRPTASDHADGADEAGPSGVSDSLELPLEYLPDSLRELYTQHGGVRLRVVRGAAMPPQTRPQWEAWTKLWPITWRIPDHGTPVTEETPVDAHTQRYFEHHMRRALQLAATAGVDNAAVIANPPALTPVAEAVDGSAAHPLRHAAMAAVQAASERDLALWPPSRYGEPDGGSGNGDGGMSASAAEGEGGPGRQGLPATSTGGEGEAGLATVHAHADSETQRPDAGYAGASGCGDAAAAGEELASKRPRLGEALQEEAQAPAPAGPRPYMCTGYDCFVVMEPCIMCAMGLVHSRIQRVIYCRPDPTHGAVGGERRLHACRSLNHNYEVFRMELKQ